MKKKKAGFTLIELIIVMAIISTLLSIVTPTAVNALKRAKATQVAFNLRNISTALQIYYLVNDSIADIQTLKNSGYLSGNTADYSIYDFTTGTEPTNDSTTLVVVYEGNSVDLNYIRDKVWDAVFEYGDGGKPAVKVFIK
ncbi:MAG: hypothetical protein PWQ48_1932 [Thermotogaceae bacterium]|jgi:prepilin-type N-terminal cleavage/methylation domain-containing protein|nr:hypothetical protein [Thermotogaceae bacterium]